MDVEKARSNVLASFGVCLNWLLANTGPCMLTVLCYTEAVFRVCYEHLVQSYGNRGFNFVPV